jgi:hypothetical protein
LLLAHKSHLRPDDYRNKLWYKITPTLGSAIVTVEAQLVTYDQLADCLLSTNINLRWLNPSKAAPTANSPARRERNRTGQFQPTSSVSSPLALGRPYDRISASPSFLTSSSPKPSVLPKHTPSISPAKADICFNCSQAGHWSSECPLPRASQAEVKEL